MRGQFTAYPECKQLALSLCASVILVSRAEPNTARFHQYKRLKRIKEQRMWTSTLNGMEAQLFAVPVVANMETNTGTEPYSIPAFVNEETAGLFNNYTSSPGVDWATVEGINPDTDESPPSC